VGEGGLGGFVPISRDQLQGEKGFSSWGEKEITKTVRASDAIFLGGVLLSNYLCEGGGAFLLWGKLVSFRTVGTHGFRDEEGRPGTRRKVTSRRKEAELDVQEGKERSLRAG